jgi:hypothetical protein
MRETNDSPPGLRDWLIGTLIMTVGGCLCVNLMVRVVGHGDVFPLSPFHIWDKTQALVSLFSHHVYSASLEPSPDPRAVLDKLAHRHKVPLNFARAIAMAESGFSPHCISPAGAMGVMQLMPDTARYLGLRDPFDVVENIEGGMRYLRMLWVRYQGDRQRVAAAYNAGPGRIPRQGSFGLPSETRFYVRRVMAMAH